MPLLPAFSRVASVTTTGSTTSTSRAPRGVSRLNDRRRAPSASFTTYTSVSASVVPEPAVNTGVKVKSVSRIATAVCAMPPSDIRSGNDVPKLSATLSPGSTTLSFDALTRRVLSVSLAPKVRLAGETE